MENKQKKFMQEFSPIKENLWRFCLHISNTREDAKDLLQETIEITYIQFEKIKEVSTLLSYMFTVASRKNQLNRNKNKLFEKLTPELSNSIDLNYVSPEIQHDIKVLYRELRQLPQKQEQAIILQEIIGLSQNEICKILDISLFALKKMLYRGKSKLKSLMKEPHLINIKSDSDILISKVDEMKMNMCSVLEISNEGGNYEK